MKAAVYYENGGPEVLRYEDVPDPICGRDQVIVDVEVISLEGGDTLHRARSPFVKKPHIVGYQCAGTVSQVGSNVRDRKRGDRVVAVVPSGSHAERVAADSQLTWLLPDGGDIVDLACVPVAFGTAHEALFAFGSLQRHERVLIHAGAGGVGLAAIQLAKAAGATVLATASSDLKLGRLRELGVEGGIHYVAHPPSTTNRESLSDSVARIVGKPDAINLVVDSVGGRALQESVACLAYKGRIVNLGIAGRDNVAFHPMALWSKNATLHGLSLMTSLQAEHERTHKVIAECIDRVARKELHVVIARRFTLAEAAAAHAHAEDRTAFGRIVMTVPRN